MGRFRARFTVHDLATGDLFEHSKTMSEIRGWAQRGVIPWFCGACLTGGVFLGAAATVGRTGVLTWVSGFLTVAFLACAYVFAFVSEARAGRTDALRGFVVGGLAGAAFCGGHMSWTLHSIVSKGEYVGLLIFVALGGVAGMIAGVPLGWLKRSTVLAIKGARGPSMRDWAKPPEPWLDEI